jgi:hypothetical protein
MVRTSRCFAGIFFQFGGPDTLVGVERFRCNSPFADFAFARFQLYSAAIFYAACIYLEGASKFALVPHDQKGEGAARSAVAG